MIMKRKPKIISLPLSKTPYLDKLRRILKDEAAPCIATCPNQAVIDGLADKVSKLERYIKKLLLCSFLNIKGKAFDHRSRGLLRLVAMSQSHRPLSPAQGWLSGRRWRPACA